MFEKFGFLKGKIDTLWQLDPFGASSTTPLLFSGDYKYAVLNRIGDTVKEQLKEGKAMDFWWYSPLDPSEGLLTNVLNIHYQTEQIAFMEEMASVDKQNLNKTKAKNKTVSIEGKELKQRLRVLRDLILGPRLEQSRTNDIMILVGDDFEFTSKSNHFQMLKSLIHHFNVDFEKELGIKVEAKISTPRDYFNSIESQVLNGTVKLPRLDLDLNMYDEKVHYLRNGQLQSVHRHDYWSGFYNSMGHHKQLIFDVFNQVSLASDFAEIVMNHACSGLETNDFCRPDTLNEFKLDLYSAKRGISLGAHHDSITGTSTQKVHQRETYVFNLARQTVMSLLEKMFLHLHGDSSIMIDREEEIKQAMHQLHPSAIEAKQIVVLTNSLYTRQDILKFEFEEVEGEDVDYVGYYGGDRMQVYR